MGMDLVPNRGGKGPHYNWSGWKFICDLAERNNVPMQEFDGLNDGMPICQTTCNKLADVIEANREEYNRAFAGEYYGHDPATEHAKQLRESGGVKQW